MVSSYFERLPVQVVRKEDVIQHSDKHAPFPHTIFNVFLASNSWVYIAKKKEHCIIEKYRAYMDSMVANLKTMSRISSNAWCLLVYLLVHILISWFIDLDYSKTSCKYCIYSNQLSIPYLFHNDSSSFAPLHV